jgi:hypothetical protein
MNKNGFGRKKPCHSINMEGLRKPEQHFLGYSVSQVRFKVGTSWLQAVSVTALTNLLDQTHTKESKAALVLNSFSTMK